MSNRKITLEVLLPADGIKSTPLAIAIMAALPRVKDVRVAKTELTEEETL